jgi:hypothetical protein
MYLLARNEEINQWLNENPTVLGGGALVLGGVLLAFGVKALLTGRSQGKWGHQMEGPTAYLHGAVLAGFGGLAILFGLYKIAMGLLGGV